MQREGMHIQAVVIRGIKTYPDTAARADFGPGLNVLVGLNGAGKSSFLFALQFALEAAPLLERERLALLHEGAAGRALTGSVEVVLSNAARRLHVDADEVSVKRVVGAQKDELFVDGRLTKREELAKLLALAGLERGPHWVVPQGRVARVAALTPQGRLELLSAALGDLEERRQELQRVVQKAEAREQRIRSTVAELAAADAELLADLEGAQELRAKERERAEVEQVLREKEQQEVLVLVREAEDQLGDLRRQVQLKVQEMSRVRARLVDLSEQAERAEDRLAQHTKRCDRDRLRCVAQQSAVATASAELEALSEGRQKVQRQHRQAQRERAEELAAEALGCRRALHASQQHLKGLERDEEQLRRRCLEQMPGKQRAALDTVRQWALARQDWGPDRRVKGSFVDFLQVEDAVCCAVATIAGASLFDLLVEDDATAEECLRVVKKAQTGRMDATPLSQLPEPFRQQALPPLPEGAVPLASQVRCGPQARKKVDAVFGAVVLCDSWARCDEVWRTHRLHCVTVDGDEKAPSGLLRGGFVHAGRGGAPALKAARRLVQVRQEVLAARRRVDEASSRLEQCEARHRAEQRALALAPEPEPEPEQAAELRQREERLAAARQECAGAEQDLATTREEQQELKRRVRSAVEELQDCRSREQELEQQLQALRGPLATAEEHRRVHLARLDHLERLLKPLPGLEPLRGLDRAELEQRRTRLVLELQAPRLRKVNLAAADQPAAELQQLVLDLDQAAAELVAVQEAYATLEAQRAERLQQGAVSLDAHFRACFEEVAGPRGAAESSLALQQGGLELTVAFGPSAQPVAELSGGQKTVVALCLLCALHRVAPAPIYLFDEVDAALDPEYRLAVARLLRRAADQAQVLCTTFRPELVGQADRCHEVRLRDRRASLHPVPAAAALAIVSAGARACAA